MAKFTTYTRKEFENALNDALSKHLAKNPEVRLFHVKPKSAGEEHAYLIGTGRGLVYLKIWSSVVGEVSRPEGEDAIRLNMFDGHNDEWPMTGKKAARVYRVEGWAKNLTKRIDGFFKEAETILFCKCGASLTERTNGKTGAKFFGCLGNCYKSKG